MDCKQTLNNACRSGQSLLSRGKSWQPFVYATTLYSLHSSYRNKSHLSICHRPPCSFVHHIHRCHHEYRPSLRSGQHHDTCILRIHRCLKRDEMMEYPRWFKTQTIKMSEKERNLLFWHDLSFECRAAFLKRLLAVLKHGQINSRACIPQHVS